MIQKIGVGLVNQNPMVTKERNVANNTQQYSSTPAFARNYTATSLVNAYQAFHGIQTAKTVSFGKSLAAAFKDLNQPMTTCSDPKKGKAGESVGSRANVSSLVNEYYDELPNNNDAIKTDIEISSTPKEIVDARTQIKRTPNGIMYEMAVRKPRPVDTPADRSKPLDQLIRITQDPKAEEKAYVLNTKGKLMAVVEDGQNVLLTNAGTFSKHIDDTARLNVRADKASNRDFVPFTTEIQKVRERVHMPSIGQGTEIVIGMEDGRFVPEIIDSIRTFENKINKGEIILDQFVANPDAKNTQLAMLAGGFGSRAEYTNASSDGIFHGKANGAQSTKGVFRTATGLTPMETTFISLHNAGLLDCSKGVFGIGKNVKFYLNQSGVNKGNGGFTVDLYNKMEREGRNSLTLFPNDSMSRMTEASRKMADIMNTGDAAIVMIAKEVSSEDAKGNFGIMKLGKDNEILEFAEKPKTIPAGYEKNGNCLTNTFQFSVSKEAFKALATLEPFFPAGKGKEPRDWSKTFVPILMSLTQKDNLNEMRADIAKVVDADPKQIPMSAIREAHEAVANQKIIAVPTDEPWADCGTLNALYHTTMQIASNAFPLEDFERAHVLNSINTQTGLVASTPEQKSQIESKYYIDGEVMAVPKAKRVSPSIVGQYINKGLISINK
ncbi:MAG: hypothetical protein E7Z90_05110 [Cyanobacteria bacterium SIG29]|nr:hypothetical protein [Cyanobacteria bacterium SIG29]